MKDFNKLPSAIIIAAAMLSIAWIVRYEPKSTADNIPTETSLRNIQAVIVDGGRILPLETEKKILAELVQNGVIDPAKLPQVTELNLLWAFGLANTNSIIEKGPIMDPRYGGPTNMASVGGWTASNGNIMDHYGRHRLAMLTAEQQSLVEKMAQGIYRPCCDNSTHFPDCNHGMAMLGLLEYLASQGASEEEMWNVAMTANINWFPDQYATIAKYLGQNGKEWKDADPRGILGKNYSSASGYAEIMARIVGPTNRQSDSGCGIDTGLPVNAPKKSGGCAI